MLHFLFLFMIAARAASWNIQSPIAVAGVSAGCFMATQMHFAYSMTIKGMACIAGGPFWCAQNSVETALGPCMAGPPPSIDYLEEIVRTTAADGFLDPVVGLAESRAWFYTATNDSIVSSDVVWANYRLYERFVGDPGFLTIVSNYSGEHAQVTVVFGNDCMYLGEPFINACGYDAAAEQVRWLWPAAEGPSAPAGELYTLPQAAAVGLGPLAYLWAPNNCSSRACRLLVVFHGCEQTIDDIGLEFVENAGYNRFADIMVLYPQAVATLLNPRGCFDWWGYTGAEYASNIGPQMIAIRALIKNIAGM